MAYKSIILILVLYFVSASAHTDAEAPTSDDPGSRFNFALDPKDPKVVELGKFVIDEENKDAKSKLNFGSVLKAVSGSSGDQVQRYALVIGASDSTGSDEYYAYVLVDKDSKELVAFKKKLN